MTEQKICIKCQSFFFTKGREITCSPLCKVYVLLVPTDTHWYIRNCRDHINPKIRYKRRFYDARSLLFYEKVVESNLVKCSHLGCVHPAHQHENSLLYRIGRWMGSWLPIKGD